MWGNAADITGAPYARGSDVAVIQHDAKGLTFRVRVRVRVRSNEFLVHGGERHG